MGCQRLMKNSPTSLASESGRVNLCYATLTQTAQKKTYKLFKVPKRRYLFSSLSHLSGSVTMEAFWCSRFLMRCQSSIISSFVFQTFSNCSRNPRFCRRRLWSVWFWVRLSSLFIPPVVHKQSTAPLRYSTGFFKKKFIAQLFTKHWPLIQTQAQSLI